MGLLSLALVTSALLSVLGGWCLAKRKDGVAAALLVALLVFWGWHNGRLSGSVQELHSAAGMFLLAGAGIGLALRHWVAGLMLAIAVGVVWVASYHRMNIDQWVQGGNEERFYWFQLLGQVTAWGLLAIGVCVLLVVFQLARRANR